MTNLTELWRKGELPSGWYYVRLIRGEHRIDLYINGKNEWIDCPDNIIDTVVCEVPSYEQWQDLKSKLQLKETAYDFDTARLEEQNAQLKEQINKCCMDAINRGTANTVKAVKEFGMPERIKELVEQNAKLKELLKKCGDWLAYIDRDDGLIKQIDELLGEK